MWCSRGCLGPPASTKACWWHVELDGGSRRRGCAAGGVSVKINRPLLAEGAEDRGDQRRAGGGFVDAAGAELSAGGVHQRQQHREMPGGGNAGTEAPVGLAALDQRVEPVEHGSVPVAKRFLPVLLGVDGDER